MKKELYKIKVGTIYGLAPSYICECEAVSNPLGSSTIYECGNGIIDPSVNLNVDVVVTSNNGRGKETKLKEIINQLNLASSEELPHLGDRAPGVSGYKLRIEVEAKTE